MTEAPLAQALLTQAQANQPMPDYMLLPWLEMPQAAQTWFLYIAAALAALTLLAGLWRSIAEQSPAPFYYCVGGALTCFLEGIFTRLLDATHAQGGQQIAFESLGQLVPWHAVLSYTFYFGVAYLTLVPAFRERRYGAGKIWLILVSIAVSAWIYEVPMIHLGLWSYYGEQPFQPYGMQPIYWSFASMAMLIVPTALIARYEAMLEGWRKILIVPLAPIGAMAAAAGTCWPIWAALNSPASAELKTFAAALTIAFSLFVAWLAIPLVARRTAEVPQGTAGSPGLAPALPYP